MKPLPLLLIARRMVSKMLKKPQNLKSPMEKHTPMETRMLPQPMVSLMVLPVELLPMERPMEKKNPQQNNSLQ